jgi:hypothetical protein
MNPRKAFEQALKKQAGYSFIKIDYASISSLWEVFQDAHRAWKSGNEQGAAEALYALDEHIEDLQLELRKLSEASKAERKKFHYVGPL